MNRLSIRSEYYHFEKIFMHLNYWHSVIQHLPGHENHCRRRFSFARAPAHLTTIIIAIITSDFDSLESPREHFSLARLFLLNCVAEFIFICNLINAIGTQGNVCAMCISQNAYEILMRCSFFFFRSFTNITYIFNLFRKFLNRTPHCNIHHVSLSPSLSAFCCYWNGIV